MTNILVKIGRHYYKAKVSPSATVENYARLCDAFIRQLKKGRLASAIRLDLQIRKLEKKLGRKNPLIKSCKKSAIGKNIRYLMKHSKELTSKTKKHAQAVAIALSTWRRACRS